MLQDVLWMVDEGFALVRLYPKTKQPIGKRWQHAPVPTRADLKDAYNVGENIGLRLGEPSVVGGKYAATLDVDVKGDADDADEAYAALRKLLPNWEDYPCVLSGGGKESRHVHIMTDEPVVKATLAKSKRSKLPWTDKAGKTHHSNRWEIQLLGTGQQVVLPPSIHPESGRAYTWEVEFDEDKIDRGDYVVAADVLDRWLDDGREDSGTRGRSTRDDDVSSLSLLDLNRRKPLDITDDEAWNYLLDLPFDEWCFDYDGWLKVGMALHHQFEGDAAGLDMWHDFSKRSDNYDADALDEKWKSFGKDSKRRPIRFATLINAGAMTRFKRQATGAEDNDDLDEEDNWLGQLDLNAQGLPKPHLDNITLCVENDPRIKGILAYNEFTCSVVLRDVPALKIAKSKKRQKHFRQLEGPLWTISETQEREGRPLEDVHTDAIRLAFEAPVKRGGYAVKISDRDMVAARNVVAQRHRFHPIHEYLESLKWDGEERVERLFVDWLGCPNTLYHREIARLLCVAAIARTYSPGCKFDFAVIIEGPQGMGKSTFIRELAKNWFIEFDADMDDAKETVEKLKAVWIAELPELSQFGKQDIETVKAFFSRREDKVRLAYRRDEEVFPRQSVFMGATNNREYLRDPTGGRRFWPAQATVKQIDNPAFRLVVDQVWAEAFVIYKAMAKRYGADSLPLFLSNTAAADEALQLQESRRMETEADAWRGMIVEWLKTPVRRSVLEGKGEHFNDEDGGDPLVRREMICALECWVDVIGGRRDQFARGASNRMAEALRGIPYLEEIGLRRHPIYGPQRCFRVRLPRRRWEE